MTHPNREELARFEAKVEYEAMTGCWLWAGTRSPSGYGRVMHKGKNSAAHRVSYLLHHGPIPEGLFICHRCDTPACVNPDHLFAGTHMQNMEDAIRKGRLKSYFKPGFDDYPRGEKHGSAKLTAEKVRQIRQRTEIARIVAADFGVHHTTVVKIRSGQIWRTV